jgi:hypothetical protein
MSVIPGNGALGCFLVTRSLLRGNRGTYPHLSCVIFVGTDRVRVLLLARLVRQRVVAGGVIVMMVISSLQSDQGRQSITLFGPCHAQHGSHHSSRLGLDYHHLG